MADANGKPFEDVRAPPRVRLGVRGPPGPLGLASAGMRTRTSGTSPGSASGGARTSRSASGFAPRPECGRGRPRTSPGSASGGARTSRSASGFAPRPGCGRGRPRTSPGSACQCFFGGYGGAGWPPFVSCRCPGWARPGSARSAPGRTRSASAGRYASVAAMRSGGRSGLGVLRGRPRTSPGSASRRAR